LAVSKRNAAYAYSGELLLTQSIQELTTLKVWHYARLSP
jgi:anionic cell wall polymer biosynthesis LytR-Cps2A-Psr (LCP) family protein